MWSRRNETVNRINSVLHPPVKPVTPSVPDPDKQSKQEAIKTIHIQAIFPAKTLRTEEEIDSYVEKIRTNMKQLLKDCDGIKLN